VLRPTQQACVVPAVARIGVGVARKQRHPGGGAQREHRLGALDPGTTDVLVPTRRERSGELDQIGDPAREPGCPERDAIVAAEQRQVGLDADFDAPPALGAEQRIATDAETIVKKRS